MAVCDTFCCPDKVIKVKGDEDHLFTYWWSLIFLSPEGTFAKTMFMIHTLFAQYRNYKLQELADHFYKEYYTTMEGLCKSAGVAANKLRGKGAAIMEHLLPYTKVVAEIKEYLLYRKDILFPYLGELSRKNKEGHDCSACKGGCKTAHMGIVMDVAVSHAHIHNTLEEIKAVSLQEKDVPDEYERKMLQNELSLLESMLTELYYLEQEVLLPKIKNAQKNIHANS